MEWIEPGEVQVPAELQKIVGGHPLVARSLVQRGLIRVEDVRAFLYPDCYHSAPPSDLPDLTLATERLERAIQDNFSLHGYTSIGVLPEMS